MKTKIIKTIFIVYCSLVTVHSYSQTWLWAESAGGPNGPVNFGEYICRDNLGNVYVAGWTMTPTCYFHTTTFTINGFNDIFLAKYDANGNEIWVKQFGGYNTTSYNLKSENVGGLVYDSNTNSIYMTGEFVGSCVFGINTLNANGANDLQMFIAKFDLNGNCIWAKSAGGNGDDGFGQLTVDSNGDIYVLGNSQYGGTIDAISFPKGGLLAKYNNNGICNWAKIIFNGYDNTSGTTAVGRSVKIFNSDIIVLATNIEDSIWVDTMLIKTNSYKGCILSRFNQNGSILQVTKYVGGPSTKFGNMSIDAHGNSYIIGAYKNGFATFNNNMDTIYSSDSTHFFLTKYDVNGNFKWVQQDSASITAIAYGVFTDTDSSSYITGGFSGNARFGSFNIAAVTSQDMFVAKYNAAGVCLGVNTTGQAFGQGVTVDAFGHCYITGGFKNTINFGSTILTSLAGNNNNIFITKANAITGIVGPLKNTTNNQLIIYANPTTGKCNITVPDEFLNETNLTLSIFDNSGKIIQQKKLEMSENKIKLDLEAEAKGIYTAVLSNGKKSYTGKIVFE